MVQSPAMRAKLFAAAVCGLVLLSFIAGGIVGLRSVQGEDERATDALSMPAADAADRLDVDATVVAVDPLHGTVRLQLQFHPRGRLAAGSGRELARDVEVLTNSTQGQPALVLHHHRVPHAVEVTLDLARGDLAWYPLDRYAAMLEIEAHGSGDDTGPVPLQVNFLSRQHTMHVEARLAPGSRPHDLDVALDLQRPAVARGFAWFMQALMLVVAASAFIVAFHVGYRQKKPEGPLLVWMSALLFVLPAFRGMLPGSPPLGVLTDYLVFFWVEGLVACCLLVMVLAWARRGTAG